MKGHAAAVLLMTCLSGNVLAAPIAKDQASAPTNAATSPEAPKSVDPAVLASILKSLPTSDLAKLLASSSARQGGPAGAPSAVTGPVGGAPLDLAGPLDGATGGSLAPVTGPVGGLTKAVKRQSSSGGSPLDSITGLLSGSGGSGGLGGLTQPLTSIIGGKRDEAAHLTKVVKRDEAAGGSPLDSVTKLLSGSGDSPLSSVTKLLSGGKRDEAAQQDSPLSALDIAALNSLLSGSSGAPGGAGGLDGVTKGLTGPLDGVTGGSIPLGSTVSGLTGAI